MLVVADMQTTAETTIAVAIPETVTREDPGPCYASQWQ